MTPEHLIRKDLDRLWKSPRDIYPIKAYSQKPDINLETSYNLRAPFYFTHSDEIINTIIEPYVKNSKKSWLDFGTGDGSRIQFLRPNRFNVTGMDNAKEMVRLTEKKGINAIKGSYQDIEGKYEVITACNEVISCILETERFISSIYDALETDGHFIFDCIDTDSGIGTSKEKPYYAYYSLSPSGELITANNKQVISWGFTHSRQDLETLTKEFKESFIQKYDYKYFVILQK